MANFKKHLEVGAIVGAISGIALFLWHYFRERKRNPSLRFNWSKFLQAILAGCSMGAIMSVAADKIEPSTNPNHRGFFHSYTYWILSFVATYHFCCGRNPNIILKNLAIIGFTGYSSHLALDMLTPKSLPLLGV